jgi:choline dehydrogenase-like flavoprotein
MGDNSITYDVVIVGAGMAGAQMAYRFAKAQRKVLLIEAGDNIPNVGQAFPVKQDNVNKFYGAAIKDPSAPWPAAKAPDVSWVNSKIYAPRPTSPGVNSDNSGVVPWNNPEGNYMQQTGQYAFGSTYERVAGGTTKHWLGTCLRFIPDDFVVMSKYKPPVPGAYDWPIGYNDLEQYYTQAEYEIGVSGDPSLDESMGANHSKDYPMLPIPQSYLDGVLSSRLQNQTIANNPLNVMSTPQGRNQKVYDGRPACMGNSSCVPICPINAKYDAGWHIKKIQTETITINGTPTPLSKFVTILIRSVVINLTVDANNNISGVNYKSWEKDGTISNVQTAIGKQYVVAAHAAETAKILLNSPWKNGVSVANSSDMVGRHLMDHICLVIWGNLKSRTIAGAYEAVYPYRGPLSTSGIESFRNDPNQRPKTAAFRIEIGNDGWSWPYGGPQYNLTRLINPQTKSGPSVWGNQLVTQLQSVVESQVRFAFEFETISGNETMDSRVTLSSEKDALGIPRPSVSYKLPQYTLDGYNYAIEVSAKLLQILGVDDSDYKAEMAAMQNASGNSNYPGKVTFTPTGGSGPITIEFRGAGHLIGTTRMGSDAAVSVVNKDLRSWDHENLYLVGPGAFPSTATSNPTLTVTALALRAADTINALLS